jgi:hypothetical protein
MIGAREMSREAVAIIAALIGAVVGSLGAQIVADRLLRRRERRQVERDLVRLHLIQLEDAAVSLLFRLNNVKERIGRQTMKARDKEDEEEYYLTSMLYVLGSFLAHKRIFLLQGHYAVLDELYAGEGTKLQQYLEAAEKELDPSSVGPLFRYDRLALAESVMRWDDDSVRICSSLEFREAYANEEQSFVHHALGPAKDFLLTKLENGAIDKLIPQLNDVTIHLAYTRRRLQIRSTLFIRALDSLEAWLHEVRYRDRPRRESSTRTSEGPR